jgi:hypothetical protein
MCGCTACTATQSQQNVEVKANGSASSIGLIKEAFQLWNAKAPKQAAAAASAAMKVPALQAKADDRDRDDDMVRWQSF